MALVTLSFLVHLPDGRRIVGRGKETPEPGQGCFLSGNDGGNVRIEDFAAVERRPEFAGLLDRNTELAGGVLAPPRTAAAFEGIEKIRRPSNRSSSPAEVRCLPWPRLPESEVTTLEHFPVLAAVSRRSAGETP